jgi:RNA polymerase sigma factor (TIGR02999 family)
MSDLTQIISRLESGESSAAEELLPLVYDELRRMAKVRLAEEKAGQTLQATALVHEAYLRLVDQEGVKRWDSSGHFFAAAATAMRRILIDSARHKSSERAGGGFRRHDVLVREPVLEPPGEDLLALNDALSRLADKDPRKAKLVELRTFAGLTNSQAAQCLGISTATAERDWAYARAWLHQDITRGDES